jgi:hypothetical protein
MIAAETMIKVGMNSTDKFFFTAQLSAKNADKYTMNNNFNGSDG